MGMAGCRNLTPLEEQLVLTAAGKFPPRDHALVALMLFGGARIHEVLALRVGDVWAGADLRQRLCFRPRILKGGRGPARWLPLTPTPITALNRLRRELERRRRFYPDQPLLPSREHDGTGRVRPLGRVAAFYRWKAVLRAAGVRDDGRLGTHCLRKTFARKIYEHTGHDVLAVKAALNHRSVETTQLYLEPARDQVEAAILAGDPGAGPALAAAG